MVILSVSLSVTVMILAFATVRGFRDEIKSKISMIHGDFVLDAPTNVENGDPQPFSDSLKPEIQKLLSLKNIKRILISTSKASIIKSEEEIEGIVAKGIQISQIKPYLGDFLIKSVQPENQYWIGISRILSQKLKVNIGDELKLVFFIQDSTGNARPRARKLKVTHLFETGIEKVDANMVLLNQEVIQVMMPPSLGLTQVEIWVENPEDLQNTKKAISQNIDFKQLRLNTAEEYNRQIFDWLSILDLNVVILLVLIAIVAITSTCTTLLILITEKTSFIGLLMTMGARNVKIQKIFIYQSSIIAFFGLLLGNLIALTICILQNKYQFLTLNQEVYFIRYVAMKINFTEILFVNLFAFVFIYLSLYIPARYIRRIEPIKAIKFK